MKIIDIDDFPKALKELQKSYNEYVFTPIYNIFSYSFRKEEISIKLMNSRWDFMRKDIIEALCIDSDMDFSDRVKKLDETLELFGYNDGNIKHFQKKRDFFREKKVSGENIRNYVDSTLTYKEKNIINQVKKIITGVDEIDKLDTGNKKAHVCGFGINYSLKRKNLTKSMKGK